MKYKPSAEAQEIVKKDYTKKIIFSPDDFDKTSHWLQVVTIPADTRQRAHSHEKQREVFYILEGQATLTINDIDYPAKSGDAFTRGCCAVLPAMFTTYGTKRTRRSGCSFLRSILQSREKTRPGLNEK